MLRFICFGSGSSGNCYFLYTENDGLMIDVGIGVRALKKNLHQYGLKLPQIKHIILTHDHADHVKSVGSLSHELNIPVYSTKLVHEGIMRNYCVRHKIDRQNIKYIEKGSSFTLGDFQIFPFNVPHDSADNVGYLIKCEGVNFCIITDAGHVTDEIQYGINQANYLVLEANHDMEMLLNGPYSAFLKKRISSMYGHLSNEACAKALAENASLGLKQVWLCHLSEENNHPELARITVEQILRNYGIVAGADFKVEVLKRKSPSGIFDLFQVPPTDE